MNFVFVLRIMPKYTVFALAVLVVIAMAHPDNRLNMATLLPHPLTHPPTGNDFGHEKARDSDHTRGSYYDFLSDGRLQMVTYNVNRDSGYVADVIYEGEAQYPTPMASYGPPQPSYKPPHLSYA
ncbi:uncharacterized protein LOC119587372 [Penaeus monodon]|uniref:uncharacterized protein LOC119587372 n=1 Tax=Penaeus monodon TaxID=6687 RepID=UPI0018A7672C|nr:uncharacterized protein LOC119587372 [Penaeus monodon]